VSPQQVPEAVDALWSRLQSVFDDTPRCGSRLPPNPPVIPPPSGIESAAGRAGWPGGNFGQPIPDVMTIVVHFTGGWPARIRWDEFRKKFTDPTSGDRGIGPHFYIPYDGTVFRLLTETLICSHANHLNGTAVGVETGNLAPEFGPGGAHGQIWHALSANAEDVPGAKFYTTFSNREILVTLWTTATRPTQTDSHPTGHIMMLPSEAQYRSWALLARWLAERWQVPRNFPLRPHRMRERMVNDWRTYRASVDADPIRDFHIRTQLQPMPINCPNATYVSNNAATGFPHVYLLRGHGRVETVHWVHKGNPRQKDINGIWTRLFKSYRGFQGHGYSGSNTGEDHNCPGAWFDWHRFAREVWDYWWFPFDLEQAAPGGPIASGRPRRVYGYGDGVLSEHYFDENAALYGQVSPSGCFPVGDETVAQHFLPGPGGPIGQLIRMTDRYWGFWHGGMHFQLNAGSPIYATAAGQLVAARLHSLDDQYHRQDPASPHPSALFVLLRHEVFFRRARGGVRIDYVQEPTRVYSLTMHLGVPAGLSFQNVVAGNPTWLNRAITMKKEYELGTAYQIAHPAHPAEWLPHTTRWARQRPVIDQALADLAAGRVARFPEGPDSIRVALGDFLGVAGHMDRNRFGLHLEVFSRDPIEDAWFERVDQSASANRAYHHEDNLEDVSNFLRSHITGLKRPYDAADRYRSMPAQQKATLFQGIALRSKSEWSLAQADFPAGNWAPAQGLMWWADVVPGMNAALAGEAAAQLPANGMVWHYHPLGFMAWLNGVTWRSEWPKFKIVDAANNPVPAPARPPRRR
jgi:hypothetical protein